MDKREDLVRIIDPSQYKAFMSPRLAETVAVVTEGLLNQDFNVYTPQYMLNFLNAKRFRFTPFFSSNMILYTEGTYDEIDELCNHQEGFRSNLRSELFQNKIYSVFTPLEGRMVWLREPTMLGLLNYGIERTREKFKLRDVFDSKLHPKTFPMGPVVNLMFNYKCD